MTERIFTIRTQEIRANAAAHVAQLLIDEKRPHFDVVVRRHTKRRTKQQNRRGHSIVQVIADQVWLPDANGQMRQFSKDAWYEELKLRFLGYEEMRLPSGEVLKIPVSTADLSTVEHAQWMLNIEMLGNQYNVEWPDWVYKEFQQYKQEIERHRKQYA